MKVGKEVGIKTERKKRMSNNENEYSWKNANQILWNHDLMIPQYTWLKGKGENDRIVQKSYGNVEGRLD